MDLRTRRSRPGARSGPHLASQDSIMAVGTDTLMLRGVPLPDTVEPRFPPAGPDEEQDDRADARTDAGPGLVDVLHPRAGQARGQPTSGPQAGRRRTGCGSGPGPGSGPGAP